MCATGGRPGAVFSVVFVFALIAFHRESADEILRLGIAWIVVVLRPLERGLQLSRKHRASIACVLPFASLVDSTVCGSYREPSPH
jgi:hypothetical protein